MGDTGGGAPVVAGLELGRAIARGATSEVWEAVREADGRRVAVKVARADRESVEAAVREASLSGAAASAHVVPVESCLPVGDGRVALVMPLLRGGSLDRLVAARGHLAPGEVVTVLAPVAGALGRLHALGVVHGDLSPGNVLLDLDGRPFLADLGLGRVVGDAPLAVWGTDGYVAPEVLMGDDPTPASDVYALGALGWLCLTGSAPGSPGLRPPLGGLSRAGEAATRLVEVVDSAVAASPEARPTAAELAWALFHAADAAPLHLVHGEDEASAVTYRLRAAAVEPPPPRRGRHRGRHTRHRAGLAKVLGTLWWRAPTRRTGVLAGLVALLAAVGLALAARPAGRREGAAALAAQPSPVEGPRTAAPGGAQPAGRAHPTGGSDPRAEPDSPDRRPAALLAALAEARAAAWRAADPSLLVAAEVAGSPAHARDVEAVAGLAGAGIRYEGLRHEVEVLATVGASASAAVIRARLGTGRYDVVGPGRRTPRPAQRGEVVLVDLGWTRDGWRVTGIRPDG
ncbi:MAG TPA: serine/threonine-protein kinase [Phycicoccus sp.]|nr:serine/threonine-protein kinase [Phycicoccus sp.]